MSEKLKPCPFCGCEAVLMTHYDTVYKEISHFVTCSYCGVCTKYYLSSEKAISAWNTRAEDKS
ncbi:MAG: Lar family restriction alleviation protein [Synergistaceae bacterium]|nr:Lar family restriction alleviation protein [Synergistaceae bacterium]